MIRFLLKLNSKIAEWTGWQVKRYVPDLEVARRHVFSLVEPEVVVDGGANRGQWVSALREWNSSIPVISFEPVFDSFTHLKNLGLDHHSCERLALSDARGEFEINVSSNVGMSSSLSKPTSALLSQYPSIAFDKTELVQATRLEDVVGLSGKRIYLKLDLEGHEFPALVGAGTLLAGDVVAIEIETGLKRNHENEETHHELIPWLIERGFRPFHLFPAGTVSTGEMNYVDVLLVKSNLLPD